MAMQSFSACDIDALPVNHPLPSASDERSFAALLARVGSGDEPEVATATKQAVAHLASSL